MKAIGKQKIADLLTTILKTVLSLKISAFILITNSCLLQLKKDVELHGPVLAVLTMIGGLDTRPRLGGLVHHDHMGVGTIAKIENKGNVTVVFHGRKAAKMCVLGVLKPVSCKWVPLLGG